MAETEVINALRMFGGAATLRDMAYELKLGPAHTTGRNRMARRLYRMLGKGRIQRRYVPLDAADCSRSITGKAAGGTGLEALWVLA